jgi:hypothetical protein
MQASGRPTQAEILQSVGRVGQECRCSPRGFNLSQGIEQSHEFTTCAKKFNGEPEYTGRLLSFQRIPASRPEITNCN